MPIHDWTLVDSGIYHAFHTGWVTHLGERLNAGLLPRGYYAIPEQHAGRYITDVLALHGESTEPSGVGRMEGGLAVAEAPPRSQRKLTAPPAARSLRRTLTIRHVSGHRVIALVEIVSPANKDRPEHVADFAAKVEDALQQGVHVLLVDILPPGPHDPHGIHGTVWQLFDPDEVAPPADKPLTVASYVGAPKLEAYIDHLAVRDVLPNKALFLQLERYVPSPLEETYQAAYSGLPAFWRSVLEGSTGELT